MNRNIFLVLLITAFTLFLHAPVLVFAGGVKVEVCHSPPDDPTNFHTIKVSDKAAPAHLGHGDFLGSCDTPASIICDDGNACTIDAYLPGTVTCDNSQPVDCGGDLCSNTTCDPVNGCVDDPVQCDASDPCVATSICDPNDGLCDTTETTCAAGEVCEPGVGCVPEVTCPCEGLTVAGTTWDDTFPTGDCTLDTGTGHTVAFGEGETFKGMNVGGQTGGAVNFCQIVEETIVDFRFGITDAEREACRASIIAIAANDGVTCD